MTIQNLLSGRDHRTLLVIDARGGFNGEQKERVNRLLQSVNGPNIKVDIAHLVGEVSATVASGNPFESTPTGYVSVPAKGVTLVAGLPKELAPAGTTVAPLTASIFEEVVAAGKAKGYTQVLLSVTP